MTPPVPADADLRGLEYMPLLGNHLFGSEFNASASDSEWRAAMTLWWAAWQQQPAGSLPNDDVALCRLADLGRDLKAWGKVKDRALHGFVECDDGRLYHQFLCKQVLVAWDKRIKERERKAKWRAEQDAKKAGRDGPATRTETGTEQGRDVSVPADGKGRDGTGRDDKKTKDAAADATADMWSNGVEILTSNRQIGERTARAFLGMCCAQWPEDDVREALTQAAGRADPKAFVVKLLESKPKRGTKRLSAAEELLQQEARHAA